MNWMDIVFLVSGTITVIGCVYILFCSIQMWWLLKHWTDGASEPWWISGHRRR